MYFFVCRFSAGHEASPRASRSGPGRPDRQAGGERRHVGRHCRIHQMMNVP